MEDGEPMNFAFRPQPAAKLPRDQDLDAGELGGDVKWRVAGDVAEVTRALAFFLVWRQASCVTDLLIFGDAMYFKFSQ